MFRIEKVSDQRQGLLTAPAHEAQPLECEDSLLTPPFATVLGFTYWEGIPWGTGTSKLFREGIPGDPMRSWRNGTYGLLCLVCWHQAATSSSEKVKPMQKCFKEAFLLVTSRWRLQWWQKISPIVLKFLTK